MSAPGSSTIFSLRHMFTVMLGVMVMTMASHLSVDVGTVPFTFQNAGVHILAMALPPGRAFLSILIWMACGVMGMPLFALFYSGAESIAGPTGGYFLGIVLAAPLMAACQFYWSESLNRFFSLQSTSQGFRKHAISHDAKDAFLHFLPSLMVGLMGSGVILLFGWIYLSWYYCGYAQALHSGVYPFLLPSLVKILISATLISRFRLSKVGA